MFANVKIYKIEFKLTCVLYFEFHQFIKQNPVDSNEFSFLIVKMDEIDSIEERFTFENLKLINAKCIFVYKHERKQN